MAAATCVWFTVSHLNYGSWRTSRQTTHRRYARWLRSLQVKATYKLNCTQDSAHELGVKFTPCTCSHSTSYSWFVGHDINQHNVLLAMMMKHPLTSKQTAVLKLLNFFNETSLFIFVWLLLGGVSSLGNCLKEFASYLYLQHSQTFTHFLQKLMRQTTIWGWVLLHRSWWEGWRRPCFEYPHKTWNLEDCKNWGQNHLGNSVHVSKSINQHLHHLIVPIVGSEVQWSDALMIPGSTVHLLFRRTFMTSW